MKNLLTCFLCITLLSSKCQERLKTYEHGLNLMLGDTPKEQLMSELRFVDGKDNSIGVVRFDHIGPSIFPLIISSKQPVATDSLGLLAIVLDKDTLDNLLYTIDNVNPKVYTRYTDYVLIRVTYRYSGCLEQYYVTNAKITSAFFRIIERLLLMNNDEVAVDRFYEFLESTNLLGYKRGKILWKY